MLIDTARPMWSSGNSTIATARARTLHRGVRINSGAMASTATVPQLASDGQGLLDAPARLQAGPLVSVPLREVDQGQRFAGASEPTWDGQRSLAEGASRVAALAADLGSAAIGGAG